MDSDIKMEKHDFYMTLASNLHTEEFPSNAPCNFVTPLVKPLELNTDLFEVAIAEIIFPGGFYNVKDLDTRFSTYLDTRQDNAAPNKGRFPPGWYSPMQLKNQLNKLSQHGFSFEYDREEYRFKITISKHKKLLITPSLSHKLGFNGKTTFAEGVHKSTLAADLNRDTNMLYIYSSIVEESVVGNSYVRLLRTVSTRNEEPGRYTTITFNSPHYRKVSSCYENQIQISLCDSNGEFFQFENSGVVHVTLHFRNKRQIHN